MPGRHAAPVTSHGPLAGQAPRRLSSSPHPVCAARRRRRRVAGVETRCRITPQRRGAAAAPGLSRALPAVGRFLSRDSRPWWGWGDGGWEGVRRGTTKRHGHEQQYMGGWGRGAGAEPRVAAARRPGQGPQGHPALGHPALGHPRLWNAAVPGGTGYSTTRPAEHNRGQPRPQGSESPQGERLAVDQPARQQQRLAPGSARDTPRSRLAAGGPEQTGGRRFEADWRPAKPAQGPPPPSRPRPLHPPPAPGRGRVLCGPARPG